MPPRVTGPLSECSKVVMLEGQLTGSKIKVYANNAVVAQGQATAARQVFTFAVPLQANQKVSATQEKDGVMSAPTPQPVVVQRKPSRLSHVSYMTHLYECGMTLRLEGTVSGADVEIRSGSNIIGKTAATGAVTKVDLSSALSFNDRITAVQTACGLAGPPTRSPAVERHPNPLPAPLLHGPLQVCQPSITVSGIVPGAQVVFYRNDVELGAVFLDFPSYGVTLNASNILQAGDRITAKQFMCKRHVASPSSPILTVGPASAIPAPSLLAPICPQAHLVTATGLIPGALVSLFQDGAEIVTCETPSPIFSLFVPVLPPGSVITARQGFCNRKSADSTGIRVREGGMVNTQVLADPLYECATRIKLRRLALGTTFLVESQLYGQISDYFLATASELEIPVGPSLIKDDKVKVKMFPCSGSFVYSNEIRVKEHPAPLPALQVQVPVYQDNFLTVSSITIGSFLDIYINSNWLKTVFGGEETMRIPVLSAFKPGDKIKVIQRMCDEVATHVRELVVPWPKPLEPKLDYPFSMETGVTTDLLLNWSDPGSADPFLRADSTKLFLNVDSGLGASSLVFESNTVTQYYQPGLQTNTRYVWKVESKNRGGTSSGTGLFTTRVAPPVPPVRKAQLVFAEPLFFSLDGILIEDPRAHTPTFAWAKLENAGNADAENHKINWELVDDDTSNRISSFTEALPRILPGTMNLYKAKFSIPGLAVGHYYVKAELRDNNNNFLSEKFYPFFI